VGVLERCWLSDTANLKDVRREIPAILRCPLRIGLRTWGERIGRRALVFVVMTHWFAVLKPEASADGLSMHLAIPANIAANHVMTFDPGRVLWAVMPMGADFTYSICLPAGRRNGRAPAEFHVPAVVARAVAYCRAALGFGGAAMLLVALFATTRWCNW
jgi:hypothetical protein